MSLNDSLANALSLMLNNERIGRHECQIKPSSKITRDVLRVMKENGYVKEFKEIEDSRGNYLNVTLTGSINNCNVVKPRFSTKISNIEMFEMRFLPAKDVGILILTTPLGIMTHYDAKQKKVGGKLLAYCY